MRNSAYEARQVKEIIQQLRRLQVHQELLIQDLSNLQEASIPNEDLRADHTPFREPHTPGTATASSTPETRRSRRNATAITNGRTRLHREYSPETDSRGNRDTGRHVGSNNTSPSFPPQNNANRRHDRPNYALSDIRRFVIGDRVRLINPGRLQETEGQIISISVSRVTLRTATGNTIVRAAINLRFSDE